MSEAGLRGRATDVAGLLLVVVALVSLLALFGDKAGIAGRLLGVERTRQCRKVSGI